MCWDIVAREQSFVLPGRFEATRSKVSRALRVSVSLAPEALARAAIFLEVRGRILHDIFRLAFDGHQLGKFSFANH